jgi:propanol-preferring alcohol dehydrogenase
MKAQVIEHLTDILDNPLPLTFRNLPVPVPTEFAILIRVSACGVCHTELDEIEGRAMPVLPLVPGHQVVGYVEQAGSGVKRFKAGDRVGVAWIHSACGHCSFCAHGRENLCPDFRATGMDVDGGYAEYMTVSENFAYPVPDVFTDVEAAPLLCAGAVGYRSLHLTGLENGDSLGLTGFGGSGHLVMKMVRHIFPDSEVFVFARNPAERSFALELGAVWAGEPDQKAPELLRAVIDTTPVWKPVIHAMENLAPGGRLVINAIRKETHDQSSLMKLDYSRHLWLEKEIKSVANVTRRDVADFLAMAAEIDIRPKVEVYSLADANRALYDLKTKKITGAKVLKIA